MLFAVGLRPPTKSWMVVSPSSTPFSVLTVHPKFSALNCPYRNKRPEKPSSCCRPCRHALHYQPHSRPTPLQSRAKDGFSWIPLSNNYNSKLFTKSKGLSIRAPKNTGSFPEEFPKYELRSKRSNGCFAAQNWNGPCPLWIICGDDVVKSRCLLSPEKRHPSATNPRSLRASGR